MKIRQVRRGVGYEFEVAVGGRGTRRGQGRMEGPGWLSETAAGGFGGIMVDVEEEVTSWLLGFVDSWWMMMVVVVKSSCTGPLMGCFGVIWLCLWIKGPKPHEHYFFIDECTGAPNRRKRCR